MDEAGEELKTAKFELFITNDEGVQYAFTLVSEEKVDEREEQSLLKELALPGGIVRRLKPPEECTELELAAHLRTMADVHGLPFVEALARKIESQNGPAKASPKTPAWMRALQALKKNPYLKDRQVAEQIEVAPSTLSRSTEYQLGAKVIRNGTLPRGFVTDAGDIEGIDDRD
jgi:hypothetical protein